MNDDFSKLPKELKKVIDEKPEKLIIYINPPYAEAGDQKQATGTGKNKTKVATLGKVYEKYSVELNLGLSIREIFTQFFIRIYKEIPNCLLASFSTLKYVNSSGFINFREEFKAKFLKGFICPANTFDNVRGNFPIGFLIWDTSKKQKIKSISVDVFNEKIEFLGKKSFSSNISNKQKLTITQWITGYETNGEILGYTGNNGPDYQNNKFLKISSIQTKVAGGSLNNATKYKITATNLIQISIYLSVRLCIEATWINDRDQFLYPNDLWEEDLEFQSDCLAFTLFHGQNRISAEEGINHWIPFSEAEVGAKDSFESRFMKDFIDGKIKPKETKELLTERRSLKPIKFSKEAKDIFEAGRELWKYYHKHDLININASYYDIRKFFQGVDSKSGRMNNKSIDETYNKLIGNLRERMKILAKNIEPKIYEFGFLKK